MGRPGVHRVPARGRRHGPRILVGVVVLLAVLAVGALLLPPVRGTFAGGAQTGGDQRSVAGEQSAGVAVLGEAPADVPAATPPRATPTRPASPTARPRSAAPPSTRSAAPATQPPVRAAASGVAALEDEVTRLVNQERAQAGCPAVRTDERLRAAARGHSQDMAANDFFDHSSQDGSDFVDRAAEAGYPRSAAAGENIAMGYRTPDDVMDGWMDSDGHRANILNCGSVAIGVGLARDSSGTAYWTQVFGRS